MVPGETHSPTSSWRTPAIYASRPPAAGPPQGPPSAQAPPEPILGGGCARRPRLDRVPTRSPTPDHRAGRPRAVCGPGTAPMDTSDTPGPGGGAGGYRQSDPGRVSHPLPGIDPRPVWEPVGEPRVHHRDHTV